jgi:hypothetical protein
MHATSRTFLADRVGARASIVACLAATLIVVGVLTRVLGCQLGLAPYMPDTALVHGFPGTADALIRGSAVARALPDERRQVPAIDGGSSAAFIRAEKWGRIWIAADDIESPLESAVSAAGVLRLAHRPRAPPNEDQPKPIARRLILASCTGSANPLEGLHRT